MATGKYDLAIVYRIYPGISKVPAYSKDDKFKLAELCLNSFKNAFGNLNPKIYVLFDNCPPEYENLFENVLNGYDKEYFHFNKIGNQATFGKQMEILTEQNSSEYVMFAEDDYFFLPNALEMCVDFLKNEDVDFLTPYDHLDNYVFDMQRAKASVKIHNGRYWRTSAATTMTFLTKKSVLKKTRRALLTYKYKNFDTSMWMAITKFDGKNPFSALVHGFESVLNMKIVLKIFLYNSLTFFFRKRRKLWSPMPSLATHMESKFLAPGIDWYNEFEKLKNAVQNT